MGYLRCRKKEEVFLHVSILQGQIFLFIEVDRIFFGSVESGFDPSPTASQFRHRYKPQRLYSSSCSSLPIFSVSLHIKHTNTTAADSFALSFYRHGHLCRMIQPLLDLNEVRAAPFLPWAIYLMANAKKGLQNGNGTLTHPFFSNFLALLPFFALLVRINHRANSLLRGTLLVLPNI